jgi:predicted RNA binding protein YcfA (HicA-like mRNA interferase family)
VTQRQKLIDRIRARPPQASFDDVRQLLETFGWQQARQSGSHVSFTKQGERTIVVPKHNEKVKRVYLDEICSRLGLD